MNSYRHPSGTTSPRPVAEDVPTDPQVLLAAIVTALATGPADQILRRNWNPDVNILSTQPINQERETVHV